MWGMQFRVRGAMSEVTQVSDILLEAGWTKSQQDGCWLPPGLPEDNYYERVHERDLAGVIGLAYIRGFQSHTTQDKDHGQQAKDQGETEARD